MSRAAHAKAQELAISAAIEMRAGRRRIALERYAEAAEFEQEALRCIPTSKPRTWGILAVSAASLLYKAKKHGEVERLLHSFLARDDIAHFARQQLKELLEVVLDEQSLPAGFDYSGQEIMFSLRGQGIGHGTAPFDLVLQKGAELKNLVNRFAELSGEFPFRRSGPPPREVSEFVQTRATQPTAGSYRFSIRLAEPPQTELFKLPRMQAADVCDKLFTFTEVAGSGRPHARDELRSMVPNASYRHAVLRLLRNVLPVKGDLSEIEIARVSPDGEGNEPQQLERIHLSRTMRSNIVATLEADQEPNLSEIPVEEFRGVLRALHLDKNWLEIALPSRKHQRCMTDGRVLDDVVGPMVNRKVVVQTQPYLKKDQRCFQVLDIELDDDS